MKLLLLLPLLFTDAESDARARVAIALASAQHAPAAKPAKIDPYSAFVADLRQQPPGTRATFTATKAIGQIRPGSTWRMWIDAAGDVVGEQIDWADDAGHRHAPAPGDHAHRCNRCGQSWYHSDASFGNAAAHTCPVPGCGGSSWQHAPQRAACPT